jgi:arylsulfatase A-like enzyme
LSRFVAARVLAALALGLLVPATGHAATPAEPIESIAPVESFGPVESIEPVAGSEAPLEAVDVRPDIITIMVDDLAYIPDDRIIERLPTINAHFRDGGVRLTHMYSETPLCCPGRAAYLTGQHTWTHGVWKNDGDLLDPRTTIHHAFQEAGYHSFFVGKYLNGYNGDKTPPGYDNVAIVGAYCPTRFIVNDVRTDFGCRWKNDVIRTQSVDWLNEAPVDQPVLAWVSFTAPHVLPMTKERGRSHVPFVMKRDRGAQECRKIRKFKPETYTTRTNDREAFPMPDWLAGWRLQHYCESLLVVDRAVAQLMAAQEERGRPAYYVLLSDNGMAWGQKGFSQKHTPPASRLPVYFKGPDLMTGERLTQLLSNIDIAPTIAEIGRVDFPSADGVSILGALKGEEFAGREEVLEVMPTDNKKRYPAWTGLRTQGWRLIRWSDGTTELYEWSEDPWEAKNLARAKPARTKRMTKRMTKLIAESRP